MTCIYCAGRRNEKQMSLEHIWPAALGGNICSSLFKSQSVCRVCNNLCGLWVDGAFLKSWFIQNEIGMNARQYMDPSKPGIVPHIYMGNDQDFPSQGDELCERWIGQTGEHVYHIHLSDDDKWYGFAGGDILKRKKLDTGRAYIVLTSQNPYWVFTALRSFIAQFKPARLFCLTTVIGMPADLAAAFVNEADATDFEKAEIAWIKARPDGVQQRMQFSLRVDFSDRFLAKLSLGIGTNILGEGFQSSSYAEELRKLLWLRLPSQGPAPKVRGRNFWQEQSDARFSQITGWPGAWTILLLAIKDGFALHVCTPSGRGMTMSISDEPTFWASPTLDQYKTGLVFIIIPQQDSFTGPIELAAYLAHKFGSVVDPRLAPLEAMRRDPALLPKPR